jgi:ABC-type phosphate transport system substrate-binding protein
MTTKTKRIELTRRDLLVGASTLVGASLSDVASAYDPVVVIVNEHNEENPTTTDLAAIFTTRKVSWGRGVRVVPFNFPAKHDVRVEFDKEILNMSPDDVARYWIDRRIRGGNAPPKQVPNGQLIVRLVQKLEGGVGYVPKSLVRPGVRIVSE